MLDDRLVGLKQPTSVLTKCEMIREHRGAFGLLQALGLRRAGRLGRASLFIRWYRAEEAEKNTCFIHRKYCLAFIKQS